MKATILCLISILTESRGSFIFSSSKSPLQPLNNGPPTLHRAGAIPCDTSLTCCHMHSNRIKIFQAYSVSEFNGHKGSGKSSISKKENNEGYTSLSTVRRKVLWNTVLFPSLPISVANAIDISSQATVTSKENKESLAEEDPFASFGKSLKSDPSLSQSMSGGGSLDTLSAQQPNENGDNQQQGGGGGGGSLSSSSAPSMSLDEAVKAKAKKRVIDPRTHG